MTRVQGPKTPARPSSTPLERASAKPKGKPVSKPAEKPRTTPAPARDIWDALSTPTPGGGGRVRKPDLNHLSADQRKSLTQCEAVVTSLRAWVGANQARLPEDLQGLKPKDITVQWGGDFPYVGVTLNGRPLTDRHFELDTLRKNLAPGLRRVPMGDVSPF